MARIAIVGPGAVGCVIAAHLHSTGQHEIVLGARRPLAGLAVRTLDRAVTFNPPVVTNPVELPSVDWVLVTTKAYDAPGAAAWLGAPGTQTAMVAILQNGVEHRERFAPFVPAGRLVPVVIDCAAERTSPGNAIQRGAARVTAPDDPMGRAFVALFAATAVTAVNGDFTTAAWRKLCLNVPGVISALLLQPAGVVHDDAIAQLARGMIRETMAVGRAERAVLPDDLPDVIIAGYRAGPRDGVNSLHADVAAGRPTEIDARNGAVVRFGRRHGIPTPYNEMAVTLLNAMLRSRGGARVT